MPAKPSTNKCDKHNSMVNRHIGTAYDTVKIVADNLDEILAVGDNLDYLLNYLGAYATHPTERPNGDPLQDGDYYFNTVDNALVYYDLAEDVWFTVDPQEVLDARDEAIAARDAAQLAQAGAETAETTATASASAAATSESNAALSESNAAVSETNAATSESNAATSASNAETSKQGADASAAAAAVSGANAATSETNAATSASEALASENAAESSEIAAANSAVSAAQSAADAEAAFDNFNDLYLGAKNEDPTTDNDGNPLQVGATYWNIPDTTLLYWSGAVWDSPEETAIQAANTAIAARDDAELAEANAEQSALDSATSATDAAASEANAATSASTAQTAATNAGNSATQAAASESAAATSETNAATSETNAATSETNALASENKAEQWAEEAEDTEVEPNKYSAKHWAAKAADSAGDVTWKVHTRGEAELNQMREQNKDARAASGFDNYGKHNAAAASTPINEGMWALENWQNGVWLGRESGNTDGGESKTDFPVTHIAGFVSNLITHATAPQIEVKFPEAPNGTVTYNSVTGEVVQHPDAATAFAAETDDIKVVIDRHDMFGGEFFLEEVSLTNPFVYPKGMIQSQATTMNGITTIGSNRPNTYYAVFDGDTGLAGLGVDFWAATDQEKIDLVSDHSNNIFLLADGRVVQWRMRQRTIAGLGNGDWVNLSPTASNVLRCGELFTARGAFAQGHADTPLPDQGFDGTGAAGNDNPHTGVFTAFANQFGDVTAEDRECYFHVWGVVRRLNQGAYHPSFNPLGANLWGGVGDPNFGTPSMSAYVWYTGGTYPSWGNQSGISTIDAFTKRSVNPSSNGSIGTNSGRDDGRFYDAIYEGGDGGVNDHRLSAWDMSSKEEAAKVFQKVVNGTYRGEELLVHSRVGNPVTTDTVSSSYMAIGTVGADDWMLGLEVQSVSTVSGSTVLDTVTVFNQGTVYESSGLYWVQASATTSRTNGQRAVVTWYGDSSVSGEFQMVDVIGDPAEILVTPDLASGWQGGWIPVIPNGSDYAPLTRKCLTTTAESTLTDNNGTSWTHTTTTINQVPNEHAFANPTGRVRIYAYTAFAKQTVEATSQPVLNGESGVGHTLATSRGSITTGGVLLAESLMGKVLTDDQGGNTGIIHPAQKLRLNTAGSLVNGDVEHLPLAFREVPNNDSPAVKALWYQTANNQQVSLNFTWNELVYASSRVISNITNQNSATVVTNGVYRFTDASGTMLGNVVRRQGGDLTGSSLANLTVLPDGEVMDSSGTIASPQFWTSFTASGWWGDDSTISITDGTSTYTNLNGDICLRGSATLSKPIGYSKNQARVGTQTEGVDL